MGIFAGVFMFVFLIGYFLITAFMFWKVFTKAGQPGWACIVPIYNLYVLTQVAGKEWWWVLLCFIPLVNVIAFIMISLGVAKNFGKGADFAVGLFLLAIVFYPILGFGSAVYNPGAPAAPAAV
jgi:uncharacterized membrane protein YhaH (DUF805 family)